VLLRLADLVPARAAELRAVAGRLVDSLAVVRAAYYHRDMRGSWSIKSVMPTIDAALAYEQLDEVQEEKGRSGHSGLRVPAVTPERAKSLRAALLRYCRHDTWVMGFYAGFCAPKTLSVSNSRPPRDRPRARPMLYTKTIAWYPRHRQVSFHLSGTLLETRSSLARKVRRHLLPMLFLLYIVGVSRPNQHRFRGAHHEPRAQHQQ